MFLMFSRKKCCFSFIQCSILSFGALLIMLTITNYLQYETSKITYILERARCQIKTELRDYNFNHSGVRKLKDLVLESGGQPLRSVIVSGWRSGSTFLGEVLNAMPGNFYHYEPLRSFGTEPIKNYLQAQKVIKMLKSMLKCDFDNREDFEEYFEFMKIHNKQCVHNARLWDFCKDHSELCYNARFTTQFCRLFPFQSMKLVLLRTQLVERLLKDKTLNVKAVLLIRDPRAVLQSRRHDEFCRKSPNCWEPELLCSDMVSDYMAATKIVQLYPSRFIVLRYEEMALNVNNTSHKLFDFLGLGVTPSLDELLLTHTTVNLVGTETFRNTSCNAFKWKNILDFNTVKNIQNNCREAMKLWGYRLADNATHMQSKEFNPLDDYPSELMNSISNVFIQ